MVVIGRCHFGHISQIRQGPICYVRGPGIQTSEEQCGPLLLLSLVEPPHTHPHHMKEHSTPPGGSVSLAQERWEVKDGRGDAPVPVKMCAPASRYEDTRARPPLMIGSTSIRAHLHEQAPLKLYAVSTSPNTTTRPPLGRSICRSMPAFSSALPTDPHS